MDDLEIRLIANSGVLITSGSLRVMVDGVYAPNRFFSPPQKEMQKAVFGMNSRYRDVDYLLHTHRHADHFSSAYVNVYTQNNAVSGVYVPADSGEPGSFMEDQGTPNTAREQGILHTFAPDFGRTVEFALSDSCRASFLRCHHLDAKSYGRVVHCSLILSFGQEQMVFLADADAVEEDFRLLQTLPNIRAVFTTPLLFAKSSGRQMLQALKPSEIVVYHLPFKADDVTGLRDVTRKLLIRYAPQMTVPVMVLSAPEQCLPLLWQGR